MPQVVTAPTLVFGWGNPSRGDDALGPLFVDRVAAWGLADVECLTDFQLQIEHALDLCGRRRILFVDASTDAAAPYTTSWLQAQRDVSFSSHALAPQALLQVYRDIHGAAPPPAMLLAIRAASFELGAAPAAAASAHLEAALTWARDWLQHDHEQSKTVTTALTAHGPGALSAS